MNLENFVWGTVIKVHEIGDMSVVEYREAEYRKHETGKLQFQGCLNDADTGHSYDTLDQAIVGTLAIKYEGFNSQAAIYFWRMVGTEPVPVDDPAGS